LLISLSKLIGNKQLSFGRTQTASRLLPGIAHVPGQGLNLSGLRRLVSAWG